MLLDKWNPVLAPDVETGAAEPAAEAPPPINESPADGPGSGRGSIRKELEKSVDTTRKAERGRKPHPRSMSAPPARTLRNRVRHRLKKQRLPKVKKLLQLSLRPLPLRAGPKKRRLSGRTCRQLFRLPSPSAKWTWPRGWKTSRTGMLRLTRYCSRVWRLSGSMAIPRHKQSISFGPGLKPSAPTRQHLSRPWPTASSLICVLSQG
jgi:hypothetical protein